MAAETRYVAGFDVDNTNMPHVNQTANGSLVATHATIDDFRKLHADDEVLQGRLRNKVRVCDSCGKPCAYTLKVCNACGSSLEKVEISYNDNIFMAWAYGIGATARFPLTISLRHETKDYLCFDDLLSLSVCHFNVIPTSLYISDLRFLFLNPKKGLEVINELESIAQKVAKEIFWADAEFKARFFPNEELPSTERLRELALAGFNFPPSMFQLHLQYIHLPLLPFHFSMACEGNHFHHGRFFPLPFLQKSLQALVQAEQNINVTEDTPIEEITQRMNTLGVNYDEEHIAFSKRFKEMQNQINCWKDEEFKYVVVNGQPKTRVGLEEVKEDPKDIQKQDFMALTNYGRPYKDGKATGTIYQFPKEPNQVAAFC